MPRFSIPLHSSPTGNLVGVFQSPSETLVVNSYTATCRTELLFFFRKLSSAAATVQQVDKCVNIRRKIGTVMICLFHDSLPVLYIFNHVAQRDARRQRSFHQHHLPHQHLAVKF